MSHYIGGCEKIGVDPKVCDHHKDITCLQIKNQKQANKKEQKWKNWLQRNRKGEDQVLKQSIMKEKRGKK